MRSWRLGWPGREKRAEIPDWATQRAGVTLRILEIVKPDLASICLRTLASKCQRWNGTCQLIHLRPKTYRSQLLLLGSDIRTSPPGRSKRLTCRSIPMGSDECSKTLARTTTSNWPFTDLSGPRCTRNPLRLAAAAALGFISCPSASYPLARYRPRFRPSLHPTSRRRMAPILPVVDRIPLLPALRHRLRVHREERAPCPTGEEGDSAWNAISPSTASQNR